MTETGKYSYLFHHTPPRDFGGTPLLILADSKDRLRVSSLEEVSALDEPIVTHSFSMLVEWLRARQLPLPREIVDLEVAQKLLIGRPKSDFNAEYPWDMPSMLGQFVPSRYNSEGIKATLATHLTKLPISEFGNLRWMAATALGLRKLWEALQVELEKAGEFHRFTTVEIPVYNAMLASQYIGLRLDMGLHNTMLDQLEEEFMAAHHQLAIGSGIDVERALHDTDYLNRHLVHPVQNVQGFADVRRLIESRRRTDRVCLLLDEVTKARSNSSILLRTVESEAGNCHPVFDTIGTVTGRILAVDPQLQRLNKKYRSVIIPRAGARLVYLDYSHFEPSIMASISTDADFLARCNSGDVYDQMTLDLCGDLRHRETIKLMFLAYCYGKPVSTLSDFLLGIFRTRDQADAAIQDRFIPLFRGIEKWKRVVQNELLSFGRIGTTLGNYRYRTGSGDLTAKEGRWAVSQVVQGTGSLVLKKLICRIHSELRYARILLPMHDALLLELSDRDTPDQIAALLDVSKSVFSEVCPLAMPFVREKDFLV